MARVFGVRSEKLRIDLDRHRVEVKEAFVGYFAVSSLFALLVVGLMALEVLLEPEKDANSAPLLIVICAAFVGAHYWEIHAQPRKWLDLRHRVLHWTEGKLWRRRRRRAYCGDPVEIRLQRSTRILGAGSGEAKATVFPLVLRSAKHSRELAAPIDEVAARRAAEVLARYFEVPLRDLRRGEVLISADQLALPLGERDWLDRPDARRPEPSDVEVASHPEGSRIRLRGGRARRFRFFFWWGLALVASAAFWRYGWYGRVENGFGPTYWRTLALYGPLPLVALVPYFAIRRILACWVASTIHVGPQTLRVAWRNFPSKAIQEVACEAMGDKARHLRIDTGGTVLRLAHGLSKGDLRYLRAQVLRGLRGVRAEG